jgi:hypothetical protein
MVRASWRPSDDPLDVGTQALTTQIERLILISHDGRQRELQFKLGALNIITGASQTGKTSIIDIVDYCLGRETFTIAEGVIRQRVAWYGVVLDNAGQQLLVARPAPDSGRKSASGAYIARGAPVLLPDADGLECNTNTEGALAAIADLIGLDITPTPAAPGVIPEYTLTPRHVTFFMFQRQDEILNREYLFHRQGEDFVSRTIRDSLPFFLRAITRDDLFLLRRLDGLQRDMRRLRAQIAEIERMTDADGAIGRRLLDEADAIDLVPQGGSEDESPLRARLEAVATLAGAPALDASPRGRVADDAGEARRRGLLSEREQLRAQLAEVRDRVASVREIANERSEFGNELEEQHARLRSLELLPDAGDVDRCPLCNNNVDSDIPAVADLTEALASVASQLAAVPVGTRTGALISQLEADAARLRLLLSENASALSTLESATEVMRRARDERQEQARVLGRISLYLESIRVDPRLGSLTAELARLAVESAEIETAISAEVVAGRTEYALSRVAADMTEFARQIAMEYSDNPLRLDRRRLTVVADTPNGQVPMNQMGSGANWVGCHLVAHLALHAWFAYQESPLINSIIFDQPSEVYFPGDQEWAEGTPPGEGDRAAAGRMLRLMHDAVASTGGVFQVILTEHADLAEPWFEEAVVERWRGGLALVPDDWPDAGLG